jgi:hypothetical protein
MDPLTSKGSKIMNSMQDQYGAEKGKQVFYASKNAGKISGVDQMQTAPSAAPPRARTDWRSPRFPATKDTTQGQTPRPGMIGGTPTTVGRAGQQMDQPAPPTLNRPSPLAAGGFREPGLTEAGNVRTPPHSMPPRGGWESPRFDAVQNPHPPIDPVAEAAEYAAGITGNPTSGESANAKNDHAKAQVFHERMARFHEARGEQNHAAAHKAASTAHQSAAAFDKGSYRRGVTGDQLGSNARDCSVRANHVSGFGRGFGGNDMTPPGQPIMSNQLPADHGSKGTGRYQLVDRQTGTSFDVEVPDHVNFTKDQGPKKLTPQPIKMPPLKSRTVQPQTMRGTTRDNWASPHFPADAGTFKESEHPRGASGQFGSGGGGGRAAEPAWKTQARAAKTPKRGATPAPAQQASTVSKPSTPAPAKPAAASAPANLKNVGSSLIDQIKRDPFLGKYVRGSPDIQQREDGSIEFSLRDVGEWVNPPEAQHEEDYDWKEMSPKTSAAIKQFAANAEKKHGVKISVEPEGEKNWTSFTISPSKAKDSDSWASPHFPADAGTSAGARKAAQTRASGGAAAPMPAKPAVAAPKPAAPKPAVAAPTAALKPAAPKPLAAKAVHAAANAVTGASHAVRGAARGVGLVARGINAATRYQERYG